MAIKVLKTLEDISKHQTPSIQGGFTKACEDINEYIWRHGNKILYLYLERWLNAEGTLSYSTRANELALISKNDTEETIMFFIDGNIDEVKMFTHNDLFEFHTREVTWYFNDIGMPISKKIEEY